MCAHDVGKPRLVWFEDVQTVERWPEEIVRAQFETATVIAGHVFPRVRYGDERPPIDATVNCHDCGVIAGQYHVPGCDMEECPACGGQRITCPCSDENEAVPDGNADETGGDRGPDAGGGRGAGGSGGAAPPTAR